MIKTRTDLVLEIEAENAALLADELEAAVRVARSRAMQDCRHGILVTRHSHTLFTVAVSGEVPFGLTVERG
ncbi:hypothetical protein [Arthrobacter sp. NPDC058192]|uniref:hypothetical protein n=1 Tax=Arthrobacter sp. NPDC058192 TaxID=3346372 RepID=UPI0036F11934